jgi:hypothetical protein
MITLIKICPTIGMITVWTLPKIGNRKILIVRQIIPIIPPRYPHQGIEDREPFIKGMPEPVKTLKMIKNIVPTKMRSVKIKMVF